MAIFDRKYWVDFGWLGDKLDTIINLLNASKTREDKMSAQLDALTAQVNALNAKVGAVVDSGQNAILLLNRLTAEIQALKEDPAQIAAVTQTAKALSDTLDAGKASLDAAITANTPAPPAP